MSFLLDWAEHQLKVQQRIERLRWAFEIVKVLGSLVAISYMVWHW